MRTIRTLSLAAGLSLAGSIAASAATLDFTDLATFTTGGATATSAGASGTIGSGAAAVTWTLSPSTTPMRYNFKNVSSVPADLRGNDNGYDGFGKVALQAESGLKLDGDGIGINNNDGTRADDEISLNEFVTLTFSKAVRITGIHVLDLFFGTPETGNGAGIEGFEIADISGDLDGTILATQELKTGNRSGYHFGAFDSNGFNVSSLTFKVKATTNWADDGIRDYALAAVNYELAPIPVPAGGILLLTAMAGLAAVRRRKQA